MFYEDVCEVFGSAGETLRIAVRRKLRDGKNLDLTCKVDLLDIAADRPHACPGILYSTWSSLHGILIMDTC